MNVAAVKAWAVAHKTQLLVGGGAAGVGGYALHKRRQNAGDPAAPASQVVTDPQTIPSGGDVGASGDYSAVSDRLDTQTRGIGKLIRQLAHARNLLRRGQLNELRRLRRLQREQRQVLRGERQLKRGQRRLAQRIARLDVPHHHHRARRAPVHRNRVTASQRARRQHRRRRRAA